MPIKRALSALSPKSGNIKTEQHPMVYDQSGCAECRKPFTFMRRRAQCQGSCGKPVCAGCVSYCVMPEQHRNAGKKENFGLIKCCRECFINASSIDFDAQFEMVGAAAATASCLCVMLHGGGGSRKQWSVQVRDMAKADPTLRFALVDLSAHGSRMDVALDLHTEIDRLVQLLSPGSGVVTGLYPHTPVVLFGYSLGGYLAMQFAGDKRGRELVDAAVVCSAGQNVGLASSFKARLGLKVMSFAFKHVSEERLLVAMMKMATKNPHISREAVEDTVLRAGAFFHRADDHIALLRATCPTRTLPHFRKPVLFINGELDHRDYEEEFLESVTSGASERVRRLCALHVLPGADHFLASDERFMQPFAKLMGDFVRNVARDATNAQALTIN